MTEEQVEAFKHAERQRRYRVTDKGAAERQRDNEHYVQGYRYCREVLQLPRKEAKRRARRALRELLASELARQASGGDE